VNRISKAAVLTAAAGAAIVGSAGGAMADSNAGAAAVGSPGVLSGNVFQHPIHHAINFCGNTHNFFALLNPAIGNVCINK
jgi:hypothetical protein